MYSSEHLVAVAQYYSSVRQRNKSLRPWYAGIMCIEMSGIHSVIAPCIPHSPISAGSVTYGVLHHAPLFRPPKNAS